MSRLLRSIQTTTKAAVLVTVLATLSACGGGSDATPVAAAPTTPTTPADPGPVDTTPQNQTIVGVETPNGVSVVTATNAN